MLYKLIKIDNESEHGYSIELFNDNIRFALFVSVPFNIHIIVGIWLVQGYVQFMIDTKKINKLLGR